MSVCSFLIAAISFRRSPITFMRFFIIALAVFSDFGKLEFFSGSPAWSSLASTCPVDLLWHKVQSAMTPYLLFSCNTKDKTAPQPSSGKVSNFFSSNTFLSSSLVAFDFLTIFITLSTFFADFIASLTSHSSLISGQSSIRSYIVSSRPKTLPVLAIDFGRMHIL